MALWARIPWIMLTFLFPAEGYSEDALAGAVNSTDPTYLFLGNDSLAEEPLQVLVGKVDAELL